MADSIEQDTKSSIPVGGGGDSHSGHPQPSSGGLFSSAKVVADAAQSAYRHESFDKAKAAGAAEDILAAASNYGKLDDKGYGKYVDQAEDYLHKIRGGGGGGGAEAGHHVEVKPSSTAESGGDHAEVKALSTAESGGIGDYLKLAEGIVHKNEEEKKDESGKEEAGFGNYFKMAEGFLKK